MTKEDEIALLDRTIAGLPDSYVRDILLNERGAIVQAIEWDLCYTDLHAAQEAVRRRTRRTAMKWNVETQKQAADLLISVAQAYAEWSEGDDEEVVSALASYAAYRQDGHAEPIINGAYGDSVYRFFCYLYKEPAKI